MKSPLPMSDAARSFLQQACSMEVCTLGTCRMVTATLHQFAESLGTAIDAKDPCTRRHSDEVASIAQALALGLGFSRHEADIVHVAGHLHDIGKIGVPDEVLCKPGSLGVKDWVAVRRHPDIGADILRPVDSMQELGIVDMVRHHHERWDGRGYPCGLSGEDIPLGARILAVADAASAIMQHRPFRPARGFDTVVREIIHCAGKQFDPLVASVFAANMDAIREMVAPGEAPGPWQQHVRKTAYPPCGQARDPQRELSGS